MRCGGATFFLELEHGSGCPCSATEDDATNDTEEDISGNESDVYGEWRRTTSAISAPCALEDGPEAFRYLRLVLHELRNPETSVEKARFHEFAVWSATTGL